MTAVEKIKAKILDLAIRGKLVPQNPDDEPASVLLERIKEEKARLVKEGKIKKEKNPSEIVVGSDGRTYEKSADGTKKDISDEIPFDLPRGWAWARLTDLTDGRILNDGDWIVSSDMSENGSVKLLQLGSVGNGVYENKGFKHISESKFQELGCTEIHDGYLLINRMIGDRLLACILPQIEGKIITAVDVCWIAPSPRYNIKYLLFLVLSPYFQKKAKSLGAGEGRVRISKGNLISIVFPLPPLDEQNRIVANVEKLLSLVGQIETTRLGISNAGETLNKKILSLAIRGLLVSQNDHDEPALELVKRIRAEKNAKGERRRTYTNAVDSLIFRGSDRLAYETKNGKTVCIQDEIPFEIPDSWEWVRLGFVFQHNTGKALNRNNSAGVMHEYITTSNVYWDEFKLDGLKKMPFTEPELEKCSIRKGDLLVCEGGDIGRAAIWDSEHVVCIQNHLHRLRPYVDVCVPFFCLVLRDYKATNRLQGKGIGLQGFSSGMVHNLLVPLPPLAEQKRIVSKVEELRTMTRTFTT